jgi:hypothetical protein
MEADAQFIVVTHVSKNLPTLWGPPMWKLIHTSAAMCDAASSKRRAWRPPCGGRTHRAAMGRLLTLLTVALPCSSCALSYKDMAAQANAAMRLDACGPGVVTTAPAQRCAWRWTHELHNQVNMKLHKRRLAANELAEPCASLDALQFWVPMLYLLRTIAPGVPAPVPAASEATPVMLRLHQRQWADLLRDGARVWSLSVDHCFAHSVRCRCRSNIVRHMRRMRRARGSVARIVALRALVAPPPPGARVHPCDTAVRAAAASMGLAYEEAVKKTGVV